MANFTYQQDKTIYKTTLPVLVNHLNYGNHLGYHSPLLLVLDARMRFLKQYGMTELNIDKTIGYLIKDSQVVYKSEAFYDDELTIALYIDNPTKKTCDFYYQITNETRKSIVAIVKTGHVFYDFKNKCVANMPEAFKKLF